MSAPLCIHCKRCKRQTANEDGFEEFLCHMPSLHSPVHGEVKMLESCFTRRAKVLDSCGPAGKEFEPRTLTSIIHRIIRAISPSKD